MHSLADKTGADKSKAVANNRKQARTGEPAVLFADNRPEAVVQRELQEIADNRSQAKPPVQLQKTVKTGPAAIQRYPEAMDDDGAKVFGSLYSTDHSGKADDDYTDDELAEIKDGVYMLTSQNPPGMQANCIGWAQNDDMFIVPGNIYTWEQEYTSTATDAQDAKIILWGTKDEEDEDNENKWDVLHASVLLTHAEIAARSREFAGFQAITAQALSDAGIEDPCWTSAGGMGFGVFVHPRDWFEGGDFGTALKGMK